MTKDEALKLALEALKELVAQTEGRFFCMKHDHVSLQNARYAIARAREALAPIDIEKELALQALHDENERLGLYEDAYGSQPEPWEKFCDSNCVWTNHHPDCKLAEQEPVAWAHKESIKAIKNFDATIYANGGFDDAVALYTTPPQRTWVGLELSEIEEIISKVESMNDPLFWMASKVEAKLKEKNT